jgi:RNA-directed DNA polymerase
MESKDPLGVAALEDKIVQGAAAMVMSAIYETEFLGFSYGFRPKRNQHQCLDALEVGLEKKQVNYVLDADIKGFFDNVDRQWLIKFIEHRIADKRVVRLIIKWFNAGVMEEGRWQCNDVGIIQGGVITPQTQLTHSLQVVSYPYMTIQFIAMAVDLLFIVGA